ncbi:MAG: DNA primase [Desulfovibrio sp.]|nr:DNA primase [Desulfovibrio sp.]
MQHTDTVGAVKARINIVTLIGRYVQLKRNGSRWCAPCPFHKETKPSFYVNEEQGSFHCFGCHASGDIFAFYQLIHGVDFAKALEALAREAGVPLKGGGQRRDLAQQKKERDRKLVIQEISTYTAKLFAQALASQPASAPCRRYLEKRGLSQAICQTFGLGWALDGWDNLVTALKKAGYPEDLCVEAGLLGRNKQGGLFDRFRARLIFPITTFPNQVIAFGGRIIQESEAPKYINSPETPIYHKGSHLYGLVQASQAIRNQGFALLTEGYMDVVTLHQFGYSNAVGVLGTSLTQEQIDRLCERFTQRLVLLFDGDPPGRKAALRACQMILPKGLDCKVVLLPEPEDIDSLLRKANGPELFNDLQAKAPDGLSYLADCFRQMAPREMIAQTHEFLAKVTLPELFNPIASRLARLLDISERDLRLAETDRRLHQAKSGPLIYRPRPLNETMSVIERQILMFTVRYRNQLPLLQDLGVSNLLTTDAARDFWTKLQEPDLDWELFSPKEQELCSQWSGKGAPPCTPDDFARELAALKKAVDTCNQQRDKELVARAIRRNAEKDDFTSDLVYLEALQQTLANQRDTTAKAASFSPQTEEAAQNKEGTTPCADQRRGRGMI